MKEAEHGTLKETFSSQDLFQVSNFIMSFEMELRTNDCGTYKQLFINKVRVSYYHTYMWQSKVETEYYSIVCFDHLTAF